MDSFGMLPETSPAAISVLTSLITLLAVAKVGLPHVLWQSRVELSFPQYSL